MADLRPLHKRNLAVVLVLFVLVMAAIFAVDTLTDYAVAAAVFYSAIILVAARLLPPRGVTALAVASVALTLLSFGLTHSGSYEVGLVNTAISIVALLVTAYLALRLVAAETAEHLAREQLLRLARVTSMGELTASIAHEVNQPLAAIATSAGAARRWLEQQPPQIDSGLKALERIAADAERAAQVIARIRGMAAKGEPSTPTSFDLNALILELEAMARSQLERHDIRLKLYLDAGLPPLFADRVQIGQVVGNLLLNAIDALAASTTAERRLEIRTAATGEDRVTLSVADSGIGLGRGQAERLFDAFWTTKKDGIGLGLTISRSIVELHRGRIWAESPREGGTVFVVELPLAPRGPHDAA